MVIIKAFQLLRYGHLTRTKLFNIIERIILVISFAAISITLLWDFNYIKFTLPISHSKWEYITLKDFRGMKKPYKTLNGVTEFASVSTSIRAKSYHNKVKITSYFHPCRSYVYNRKLFSDGLLTHEIYHFHITEYCARLLRKKVYNFIQSGNDYNLSKNRREILIYERTLQSQYDEETYHNYIQGKQIEWQNKIDSLLKSLEDFSNPTITLKN